MRSNFNLLSTRRPHVSWVTADQLQKIHGATLEVLERTGMRVLHPGGKKLLLEAGCVEREDRVFFPVHLVEEAIRTAPSRISIYDGEGELGMTIEQYRTHFGTGSDLLYMVDLETQERRPSRLEDVVSAARITEALDDYDFVMSYGFAKDYPPKTAYLHQFLAMVKNTRKPVIYTADTVENNQIILEMAATLVGGKEALLASPFLLLYTEPISPLIHTREGVEKMFAAIDYGVPVVYTPGILAGGTTPVTKAGTIVQMNAESLAGLVMAQLKRKGAPFLIGGGATPMDMKTMACLYGAPETQINYAIMTQLSRYYSIPNFTEAGCTNSKLPDIQAGMEAMMGILLSRLSGANLVHDVGYLDGGKTGYLPFLLLCHDFIRAARYMRQPVQMDREALGVDVIDEVGPGGNFLQTEHTAKYYRQEIWEGETITRDYYESWEKGGRKSSLERAQELTREILSKGKEILDEKKAQELQDLIPQE